MKKVLIILLISLIICGCSNKDESDNLEKILKDGNYIIVDVRSKYEYNGEHIKDAINIPYDEITEETNLDKEKTILVYCMSGGRSKIAYDKLKSLGYKAYDLGGISEIDLPKE